MSGRVVCVTGATGFLAGELVAQLLERGHTVRATVRSLASSGKRVEHLQALPGARQGRLLLHEADLLETGSFDEAVRGADTVYHTASPFMTTGVSDPQTQLINPALNGTRNVFSSISKMSSAIRPTVILTSSAGAVLGNPNDKAGAFVDEDWNTACEDWSKSFKESRSVHDAYKYSKVAAEREAWDLAADMKVKMAAVNPTFILGPPRMTNKSSLLQACISGESLRNTKQSLEGLMPHRPDGPMVDVRDVARVHILADAQIEQAHGKRFLVTTPTPVRQAWIHNLLRLKYPDLPILDLGETPQDFKERQLFECRNMHNILNYKIRPMEETILDMAAVMLERGIIESAERLQPKDTTRVTESQYTYA